MKRLALLTLLWGLCGCSYFKKDPAYPPINNLDKLKAKFDTYLALSKESTHGRDGFISTDCDTLLFSGLYGSVPGTQVALEEAEETPGKWQRRRLKDGPCYPTESSSEISRDDILGVIWYVYANKRPDLLTELAAYGEAHNWAMGAGSTVAVLLPSDVSLLYDAIYRLTGKDNPARKTPLLWPPIVTGYKAHLGFIDLILRSKMDGAAEGQYVDYFKYYAQKNLGNALYSIAWHKYTDGDYADALMVLLDNDMWPENRLPDSSFHCEEWLWQRDQLSGNQLSKDWSPCPKPLIKFTGADWLFAAHLILF